LEGLYQQDQVNSEKDFVAALRTSEHHLKLFRGEVGAEAWSALGVLYLSWT